MSESFKQQGVPGEVPSVVREDFPRPHLGRSDGAVPPTGLPALGVDSTGFEVNIPSTQPLDDLPLDAGSSHEGLHCPLSATEGADQSLSLYTGKPNLPSTVWLRGCYVFNRVVGDDVEFYEMVGEDTKGCPIPDLCAPADWQALQEKGDVALGEVFCAESLSFGDHAPDLTNVLGIYLPLAYQGRDVYLLEAINERGETVRFVSNEQVRKGSALEYNQLQRLPLESPLQGANHPLDRNGGPVVGGATSMRSAPLVREIEAGFPDGSALGSERHSGSESTPGDAPGQERGMRSEGVSLCPERDSNSYADFSAGDFETDPPPLNRNDLPDSPSVKRISLGQAKPTSVKVGCPPRMPPQSPLDLLYGNPGLVLAHD